MFEQFGRYKIQREIGRGGFGHVYLADDPLMNRQVAVKVLTELDDPTLIARFRREAIAAGNLHHRNIVTVYDVGEDQQKHYLVMEFLDGRDLQHIIDAKERLAMWQKVDIMSQIADGLHCAHQSGVVHRDVKPANILVMPDLTVKILDFGIAQLTARNSTRVTETGSLVGTVRYMAPEHLNDGIVDALSDIWSYGVIYYEMLTGRHPFQANDTAALMYRVMHEDPVGVASLAPDCPAALHRIVGRLLAKRRETRYQSLAEVQYDTFPVLRELKRQQAAGLLTQATSLFDAGRYDEAQPVIRSIQDLDPGNAEAGHLRKMLALGAPTDLGNPRAAKRALSLEPGDASLPETPEQIGRRSSTNTPSPKKLQIWKEIVEARKSVGVTVGILILFAMGWFAVHELRRAPPVIPVKVSSQEGVSVRVGGNECVTPNCTLRLGPGTYRFFASKDGYQPVNEPLVVKPGQGDVTTSLSLIPLPEIVQVNTNFSTGTVTIDSRRAGDLVNGSFSISGMAAGEHLIEVNGDGVDFKTQWRSQIGAAPTLVGRVEAKDLDATVISSVGTRGKIASHRDSQAIKIDGTTVGYTGTSGDTQAATGISLVGEGVRKLEIGDRSTFLEVRPNPTLSVLLALNRNVGILVVETEPGGTKVYLNDRPYGTTSDSGVLRASADIGRHSVRVAKDGFRAPGTQVVDLAKGEEKKLTFTLVQMPGILHITGLTAGDQISIDGRSRGVVGSSQTVRFDDLPAGEHTLEIARDGYHAGRQEFQIIDGKTTNFEGSKLVLVKRETSPAQPGPAAIEAQEWERVHSLNSIGELQSYLNQHTNGQHAEEARNQINQLRQAQAKDAEANALRDQESVWTALDKNQRVALQEFITRYGNSPHAPEARTLLNGIAKKEADSLAAQRANEQRIRDQDAVKQALSRYQTAISEMNLSKLKEAWAGAPAEIAKFKEQFGLAKKFEVMLSPVGQATIEGDSASVECTRTVTLVPKIGKKTDPPPDRVRVTFARSGSTWLIRTITPF